MGRTLFNKGVLKNEQETDSQYGQDNEAEATNIMGKNMVMENRWLIMNCK